MHKNNRTLFKFLYIFSLLDFVPKTALVISHNPKLFILVLPLSEALTSLEFSLFFVI